MARDILSEYGPDHTTPAHSPGSSGQTTEGGKPYEKHMPYSPPTGPLHQGSEKPGLMGGENHGSKGTQGSY